MAAHDHTDAPAFDPNDPHGHHAGDTHGHVIVPQRLLLGVLAVLLFLTFATVGAAKAEVWLMDVFDITLPWWVNVVVALSIAVVKGVLVLAIFMQLWFDNRLNLVAFATCLICVALFMGFSVGDRATRGALHSVNQPELTTGGNAFGLDYDAYFGPIIDADGNKVNTAGLPIAEVSRLLALHRTYGSDEAAYAAAVEAHHHHDAHLPNADHTLQRTGLTPGLFDAEAPSHDDHGHGHDDHAGDDHADGDHDDHGDH